MHVHVYVLRNFKSDLHSTILWSLLYHVKFESRLNHFDHAITFCIMHHNHYQGIPKINCLQWLILFYFIPRKVQVVCTCTCCTLGVVRAEGKSILSPFMQFVFHLQLNEDENEMNFRSTLYLFCSLAENAIFQKVMPIQDLRFKSSLDPSICVIILQY